MDYHLLSVEKFPLCYLKHKGEQGGGRMSPSRQRGRADMTVERSEGSDTDTEMYHTDEAIISQRLSHTL